jgi:hypothetical protein
MGMNPMMMKAVSDMAMKRKKKMMASGGMVEESEEGNEGSVNAGDTEGEAGDPVYPEGSDKEGLSESVMAEQALAKGLQERRMKANDNYNEYDPYPGKQAGKEMNKGGLVQSESGQPLGNKPDLGWVDDGSEEPMSELSGHVASLAHPVVQGVPGGPALSEEAKKALADKKMKRRFSIRG